MGKDIRIFVFVFLPISYVVFGFCATAIYFATRVIGRSSPYIIISLAGLLAALLTSAFYLFAYEHGVREQVNLFNWISLTATNVLLFIMCAGVFCWIARMPPSEYE